MSTPSQPESARRYSFGPRTLALLLGLVVALDVWAMSATDPDFYLPDVFRPISLALVVLFAATGLVRWRWLRRGARILGSVVVVALVLSELASRYGDVGDSHVETTSDRVLRYRYRPGDSVAAGPDHSRRMEINHLGLWDREYAIPKPPDVYRILVLSGSIANDGSIPFESRFHEVLEASLGDTLADGRRIEVINVSCDGWNTTQQVRMLELYAMEYEPDFVVVAYMLTSASIQNGAYRRVGNSFFTFRFLPLVASLESGSSCSLFAPFHERYTFDLVVRSALERLALLRTIHGFRTLVAVLPVLEEFDDPVCGAIYDRVVATARESGHDAIRVADAFAGEDVEDYVKPEQRLDLCHPNPLGHARIAGALEDAIRGALAEPATE